jgi:uncharacterized protein
LKHCASARLAHSAFRSYNQYVSITCDHAKRLANLDKHGLDFADLDVEFFLNSVIVVARAHRFKAIDRPGPEVMIAAVFALLGAEAISVVFMRVASRKERNMFDGD